MAERLVETLLAIPMLARQKDSIFHADPHAGNLLYDKRRDTLIVLDWALTEHLTRYQRKAILVLVIMMILRDPEGMARAIEQLRVHGASADRAQAQLIRNCICELLQKLPLARIPGAIEAMELLDRLALQGIRFPAALLMFRKASFTLEGVLEDIAGPGVRIDSIVLRYALAHWTDTGASFLSLLSPADWIALDWSALTFAYRVGLRVLWHGWQRFPGLSPQADAVQ